MHKNTRNAKRIVLRTLRLLLVDLFVCLFFSGVFKKFWRNVQRNLVLAAAGLQSGVFFEK